MKSNVEEILLVPESTINFIVEENELLRECIEKALSYIEDLRECIEKALSYIEDLRECIEKALSYIEQHDLYNVDWDYNYENYEEELEYRGTDDTAAREDLIAILKGEDV